jgi:hypothetical protein
VLVGEAFLKDLHGRSISFLESNHNNR